MITGLLTFSALAEVSSPTTLGAPEHFGVSHYSGSYVKFAFGVPKDLRTYIEKRSADDPENKQPFLLTSRSIVKLIMEAKNSIILFEGKGNPCAIEIIVP